MKASLSPTEFRDLLLSHHPNHSCFNGDVVILFGKRICAGCLMAYPIAIIVFFVFAPNGWQSIFVAIGLSVFSQTRRLVRNKQITMLFRGIAGVGLGFGIGGLIWAINAKDWFALTLLCMGAIIYGLARTYFINKKLNEFLADKQQ